MHIPDGLLDTKTLAGGWAAAIPALGWALRHVRRAMSDGRLVLMAVLAALVFALQMLNFPVAGGTSGHFAGGALVAILLGPWPAVIVLTSVLIVQAFLFADGGITALGANIVNMALVAPFVGWWLYSAAVRIRDTRVGRTVAAFAAAWGATVAAALSAALMVWASGAAPLLPVVTAMGAWHAVIGIGEGLVTAGLVAYVRAIRPELLKSDAELMSPRGLAISLGIVALLAAGVSFAASSLPDALEHVAGQMSFLPGERPRGIESPLGDYVVPGIPNESLAGVLAALVGVVVTGALLWALLQAIRRRRTASR